jgi:hypothetical protein
VSHISSTRTVFDILWSCLFTIFACTWTVQHLNVPPQREESGDPEWKGDLKYAAKNFWTSAKWMMITVLAPEVLITLNAGHLLAALATLSQIQKYATLDGVPWTLTHSLFANMGGFVVREYAPERVYASHLEGSRVKKKGTDLELITVINDGDRASDEVPPGTKDAAQRLETQPPREPKSTYLLADEILQLRERGIIKLPYITKEEIMDKGKSDSFARLIAIGQTLWLAVQMIVRAGRHLEVSQLEVGTAAFVSCALVIYALNWHKPKGVGVPWTLWSYVGPMPKEIRDVLPQKLENQWFPHDLVALDRQSPLRPRPHIHHTRVSFIPNSHRYTWGLGEPLAPDASYSPRSEVYGFVLASIVFGAIHFAAINSTFPSRGEEIAWYVASAICTTATLLMALAFLFTAMLFAFLEEFLKIPENLWQPAQTIHPWFIIFIYIIARLFLIVELFRCLFFLPPSAFVSTWVSTVPHVS